MTHYLDRRALLTGFAATGATLMLNTSAEARARKLFFDRIGRPIGLQLYTLGDEPAKDLDGVLAKVAAIGYRDLQLPNFLGKTPAELKAAGNRAGVTFSCVHLGVPPLTPPGGLGLASDTQRIVDELGALGVRDAVMPLMPLPTNFSIKTGEDFRSAIVRVLNEVGADHWKMTAALLNEKAAALKPYGIRLGYHNHNCEFIRFGKRTGWDILAGETDKNLVFFEVDVGWVKAAGLDPAAFLRRHTGRVRWLHVKDVQATTKPNIALQMDPTEVGYGVQDWARILNAAHKAGCERYYVEQEPPFAMARIDAAAKGYGYLSKLIA